MGIIFSIHRVLGEMVLPLLTLLTAIILTATWKPDAPRSPLARFFPMLVNLQVLLGLIYFVYLIVVGGGGRLLTFPFLLHPILGFLSAGIGQMAVSTRGPFVRLGRWAPLVGLLILLVLVVGNVVIARMSV
jgi:hypothetical protein